MQSPQGDTLSFIHVTLMVLNAEHTEVSATVLSSSPRGRHTQPYNDSTLCSVLGGFAQRMLWVGVTRRVALTPPRALAPYPSFFYALSSSKGWLTPQYFHSSIIFMNAHYVNNTDKKLLPTGSSYSFLNL